MHRLGEIALHRGGVAAFIAAVIVAAIVGSSTPMYVHHPVTTSIQSPLCPGGACVSHTDLKSFNDTWGEAVLGGFFGGAILGFAGVSFLVAVGVPRQYLGLPDE